MLLGAHLGFFASPSKKPQNRAGSTSLLPFSPGPFSPFEVFSGANGVIGEILIYLIFSVAPARPPGQSSPTPSFVAAP